MKFANALVWGRIESQLARLYKLRGLPPTFYILMYLCPYVLMSLCPLCPSIPAAMAG